MTDPQMLRITDTHVHIIDQSQLNYHWLRTAPPFLQSASYEEYATQAKKLGINRALHMEVDVDEPDIIAETDMITELINKPDSLLTGAIAGCRPESSVFPEYLERQSQHPHIKGFRRVLHVVPDEVSRARQFRENISLLSNTRYVFDLCVLASQIPIAIELVDLCPDVQFVLDHCGVPDIKDHQYTTWAGAITELAKRPNVAAKLSGVMAYCDGQNWVIDDLRPYIEHTILSFGWDNVVWGSDSPVCRIGGSLSDWVAVTLMLIQGASEHERSALLHTNATRIWQLP